MESEYYGEPRSFDPGSPASFDAIAEVLGSELSSPSPEPILQAEATNVVHLPRSRKVQTWFLSAAAVLVAVVGAGAVLTMLASDEPESVSTVELAALTDLGAASAELVDGGNEFSLVVDVDGVDPGDGYLELWLIDSEITQLISLGPIQDDGVYELPAGLDPADFPVVDVSVENFDGDPSHGGASVFRGQLEL
ncbi:MAG: anti-sigma factor [Actinomycetota bacterium]